MIAELAGGAAAVTYAVGYALSIRRIAGVTGDWRIRQAEAARRADQQAYPHTWQKYHPTGDIKLSDAGRISVVWVALFKALFWPVVILVYRVAATVVTPSERAARDRAELERLREMAETAGLQWPEMGDDR